MEAKLSGTLAVRSISQEAEDTANTRDTASTCVQKSSWRLHVCKPLSTFVAGLKTRSERGTDDVLEVTEASNYLDTF